ncbi:type II secretion system protein [bacterium]|nr:type II secretion system protein [bacterium]
MPGPSRARRQRRHAFTIIELLAVLGVIAILLAIAFPVYTSIRANQRLKRSEGAIAALVGAVEAYKNDWGLYPPADTDLVEDDSRGNRALVYFLQKGEDQGGRSAPYLPSLFYNDARRIRDSVLLDEWDRPFIYFDGAAMKLGVSHAYPALRGNPAVSPSTYAEDGDTLYYAFGRFQLWSCGPNGVNDGGHGRHNEAADDIASFDARD